MTQLTLDLAPPRPKLRWPWSACWPGWEPAVGGFAEIGTPIPHRKDGRPLYAYMERVRILDILPGDLFDVVIDMPDPAWPKNGEAFLLTVTEIWPPVCILRHQ